MLLTPLGIDAGPSERECRGVLEIFCERPANDDYQGSNVNTTIGILFIGVFWVLCPIMCALKGKWGMFFFFPVIGACRLAKPNSYWYRENYSEVGRAKADARFAPSPLRARMEANAARERAEIKAAKAAKAASRARTAG